MNQAYLRECLEYGEASGLFTWCERPRHHFCSDRSFKTFATRRAHRSAGSADSQGYVTIRIDGVLYYAHRLAWLWATGENIPAGMMIDHINGDRADNRLGNLRLASQSENGWNSRVKAGKTLPKGVHFDKTRGAYMAYIRANGIVRYFGRYKTAEEAAAVVRAERQKSHGEFTNHGDAP